MKHNILYTLMALLLMTLVSSCNEESSRNIPEPTQSHTDGMLTVALSPSSDLKAIYRDPNSQDILLEWNEGNFDINVFIKQGDIIEVIRGVEIKNVSADKKSCVFDIKLPETIDLNQNFDMYGAVAENIQVKDGKILVGIGGRVMYELSKQAANRDGYAPVTFAAQNISVSSGTVEANFEHLGAMAVINIHNSSEATFQTAGFAVVPAEGKPAFYHKAALPFIGNTELPYIDLLDPEAAPVELLTRVVYPAVNIPAGKVQSVGFWFAPNSDSTPEIDLIAYDANDRKEIRSTTGKPARGAMLKGHAYHINAEWNGAELILLESEPENPLPENQPVMRFKTTLEKGDLIFMTIGATSSEEESNVWIDFNNNGKRDRGEYVTTFSNETRDEFLQPYVIDAQEFAVYGEVSTLVILGTKTKGSQLTAADLTANPYIEQFFTFDNNIPTLDLSKNPRVRRLALDDNQIKSFTLSKEATGLEELYLTNNKLTMLFISMATNALLVDVSNNELTSLYVPYAFNDIWGFFMENNKLDKAAIERVYSSLNSTAGKSVFFDWQYSIQTWGNPGAAEASKSIATSKGWTVIDKEPYETATAELTSRHELKAPLRR